MVRPLRPPVRPLPRGGKSYQWRAPRQHTPAWQWCRVYHAGPNIPTGHSPRPFGPLARFDPHTPSSDAAAVDLGGRSVLYVGADLATSACEVFGEAAEAPLCESWRVALLRPTRQLTLFDLCAPGAAMEIGALPALADAALPRGLTQRWARAIYEDDPLGRHVAGIRCRSAYNGGAALALWDCAGLVETVTVGGTAGDVGLREPAMLERLMVALAPRRITINLLDKSGCRLCS